MAKNEFKTFAAGNGANVTSQADYESLPARTTGFTSGKASSAQVNKALRQATAIGALIGQFIANGGGDALDSNTTSELVEKFTNALKTNLSLGTAAGRDVGIGLTQIPDMSMFSGSKSEAGYQYFPNGMLIQWGTLITTSLPVNSTGSGFTTGTFPIAFPNAGQQIFVTHDNPNASVIAFGSASIFNNSSFRATSLAVDANGFKQAGGVTINLRWMAIGS